MRQGFLLSATPAYNRGRMFVLTADFVIFADMKKLVISTGAGMSAESGIATFRDAGGLWDRYPVMEVASADGFRRNPALVHEFYNKRR